MLGTGPAGLLQANAQCAAGSVQLDHCRVRGDSLLRRDVNRSLAFEIDLPEHFRVLRAQGGEKRFEAAAELRLGRHVRGRLAGGFPREGLGRSRLRVSRPPVVDHRVAEEPVEPGDHPLFVADLPRARQSLRERVLKDLFGIAPVPDSLLDEGEKPPVVFDERRHHGRIAIRRRVGVAHGHVRFEPFLRLAGRSQSGDPLSFNRGFGGYPMNAEAWPNVLTNTLAAVYRVDQADPTWRRAREVVLLEAEAEGGTAEDGLRAIEAWEARGCLARAGSDWRITDRGRDEAKRLIKTRLVSGYLSAR